MLDHLYKIFICASLLFAAEDQAMAQSGVPRIPRQYGQFYSDYALYNPGAIGTDAQMEFNVASQLYAPGLVENVYSYYARGEMQLTPARRNKQLSNHVVGLNFIGDREGDLLIRSRAYLQYAVHINLDESLTLSAGTGIGFASYVVRSSPASAGGADVKPDVNMGLWLYSDRFRFGISANQISEGDLQPIDQISTLQRYVNIMGEHRFDLSHNIRAVAASMVRWVPEFSSLSFFDVHGRIVVSEKFSAGSSYRQKRGLSFLIGLEAMEFQRSEVFIRFAYNAPLWTSDLSGLDTFELIIGYNINGYK